MVLSITESGNQTVHTYFYVVFIETTQAEP